MFHGAKYEVLDPKYTVVYSGLISDHIPACPNDVLLRGAMFYLACTACAWEAPDADLSVCPDCGATIDVRYDAPQILARPDLPGIWRYAAHLPLHNVGLAISLGEGGTPLLRAARLTDAPGSPELYFKIEGANPTGSYKDRIAAV